MKNIPAILALMIGLTLHAQDKGIRFEHDKTFAELKTMAREQNKLIFMDCYTTWCGPCKYLAAEIFTLPEIGDYYNQNFINCKFDMEKGEGINIGKQYGVKSYPTLLFINAEGELEHKKIGGRASEEILNMAKNASDKENNFKAVSARIKAKTHSPKDIKNYLNYNKYGSGNADVLEMYFKELNDDGYYTKETWDILNAHLSDLESNFGQFFITHRDTYAEKNGSQAVSNKLFQLFTEGIQNSRGDETKIAKLKAIDPDLANEAIVQMDLSMSYGKLRLAPDDVEKVKNFIQAAGSYLDGKNASAEFMNIIAWDIYEGFHKDKMSNPDILATGLRLSHKMVELAPENPMLLDTHAHLLFIGKDVQGAVNVQKKAIMIVKNAGEDTTDYVKELASFYSAL